MFYGTWFNRWSYNLFEISRPMNDHKCVFAEIERGIVNEGRWKKQSFWY